MFGYISVGPCLRVRRSLVGHSDPALDLKPSEVSLARILVPSPYHLDICHSWNLWKVSWAQKGESGNFLVLR